MKILSIDVGIKNLAYCLIEVLSQTEYKIIKWDVINLCGKEDTCNFITKKGICENKAKYHKNENFYCNVHSKKSGFLILDANHTNSKIKNAKLSDLLDISKKYNINIKNTDMENHNKQQIIELIVKHINTNMLEKIVPSKSANTMNLVSIGIELCKQLDKHIFCEDLDQIIIENQIGPIAIRMKSIQGMITQYFIMKNITNITFVSSANKLKRFISEKTTYDERRKLGINITKDILEKSETNVEWIDIITTHKKRDDLADSFLQGLWFLEHNQLINIKYNIAL
jgi:hypothetical protein